MIGTLRSALGTLERRSVQWLAATGVESLRYGLALIYVWFGVAKLWAPGEGLAIVVELLAIFGAPPIVSPLLAVWEVVIGLLFLRLRWARYAALLATIHLIGTFLPLLLLPDLTFKQFPLWLTLDGQFIVKNIVLHGAALVIWAVDIRRREAGLL